LKGDAEGEAGLQGAPAGGEHAVIARLRSGGREQGGLADPGLTGDAQPATRRGKQARQSGELALALD
jgi:hypothetical protein